MRRRDQYNRGGRKKEEAQNYAGAVRRVRRGVRDVTTTEAADAFLEHFGKLKTDSVPAATYMLVNNERHVAALKEISLGLV